MSAKKRFSHVDLIESIAIFFVVFYHCTLYPSDVASADAPPLHYVLYFCRTIFSTCVPLFFFVNGYLLFNRSFNLQKHIKKILRLVLLVFVWGFLLMPIFMLIAGEPLNLETIFKGPLTLNINWSMTFFWYLGALVGLYILFPALKALYDKSEKGFVFFIVAVAICTFGFVLGNQVMSILSKATNQELGDLNYPGLTMFNPFYGEPGRSAGYSFVYFCVGGLIYKYEDKILAFSKAKRNLIGAAGILLSCTGQFFLGLFFTKNILVTETWDVVFSGYDTIFTFCNVICIYVLSLSYTKDFRVVKSISANTLGIYFLHMIPIRLTMPWILQQEALCNFPFNILYAFLVIAVCVPVSMLLKKIPVLRNLV